MPASAQLLVILVAMLGFLGHRHAPGPQPAEARAGAAGQPRGRSGGRALRGDLRDHSSRWTTGRVELEVAPGTVLTVARQVVVRLRGERRRRGTRMTPEDAGPQAED